MNSEELRGLPKSPDILSFLISVGLIKKKMVLFFGPPGLGKTHLSIALGFEAIEKGYSVCFERVSNLMRILQNIRYTASFRIQVEQDIKEQSAYY